MPDAPFDSSSSSQLVMKLRFMRRRGTANGGTPLCYRKYLFGLFPSTLHIKPALQVLPKKKAMAPSRYESYDDLLTDDPYMSLLDPEAIMNEEDDEGSDEMNFDPMDDNYMNRSDRGGSSDGEGENATANEKEDDEVMEGDIVVVTLPAENMAHMMQTKAVLRYPRSISLQKLPEAPKMKEKERRAVVVKMYGKERVGVWWDA